MVRPMASKVRLYVNQPLGEGQSVTLSREQSHYLFGVMRLAEGAVLSLINGQDGEWDAIVAQASRKAGILVAQAQTAPMRLPPDLWLVFAPIRKERTAFIVEKAVELGAAFLQPVRTAFTQSAERLRIDRLQAHAIEAAEQCGGTFVPDVAPLVKLDMLLQDWPPDRQLLFCDEAELGEVRDFPTRTGPAAIVIGPEGGFSAEERARLHGMSQTTVLSLGPRILRADTAAVAALTLWQYHAGDWR